MMNRSGERKDMHKGSGGTKLRKSAEAHGTSEEVSKGWKRKRVYAVMRDGRVHYYLLAGRAFCIPVKYRLHSTSF